MILLQRLFECLFLLLWFRGSINSGGGCTAVRVYVYRVWWGLRSRGSITNQKPKRTKQQTPQQNNKTRTNTTLTQQNTTDLQHTPNNTYKQQKHHMQIRSNNTNYTWMRGWRHGWRHIYGWRWIQIWHHLITIKILQECGSTRISTWGSAWCGMDLARIQPHVYSWIRSKFGNN